MPNSPEDKQRALNRVRRIKGQCEAIERALESGVDCGPVLQQIAAVRGAINGLMAEVLETYMHEEFAPADDSGGQKVQELLTLVRSYLK
jgi:FrmR/RcnR family transcriptional regulator, repressor of frmRAB operon